MRDRLEGGEGGGGLIRGGDELDFRSRQTTHNNLNKVNCPSAQDKQEALFTGMALCYIKATPTTKVYDRPTQNKTGRLKWGGGEKGTGWRGASVSDHVGEGTWTITK